jgi:C-terminal processing protease CtpA/Prc
MRRKMGLMQALRAAGSMALLFSLIAVPMARGQVPQPPKEAAKDEGKDPKSESSNAGNAAPGAEQNQKSQAGAANSGANAGSNNGSNAAQNVKGPATGTQDSAKVSAKDAKDSAKVSAKDVKGAAPTAAHDAKDTAKDATKDTTKDATKAASRTGQASGSSSSDRSTFRASDVRSADIGLWFDRSARDGLVISDIASQGAISKLGFQEGDRFVSVNGHKVGRESEFLENIFSSEVRDNRVKVVVLRDGAEVVVWINPTTLRDEYRYVENDPVEALGIILDDRYDDRIVVWKVIPRSPVYYAGIRAADVFTTFRGQPVSTRQDFVQRISKLEAGSVPVQVRRGDRVRDFVVEVPRYEARSERRTAMRPNLDNDRQQVQPERRDPTTVRPQDNHEASSAKDRALLMPLGR